MLSVLMTFFKRLPTINSLIFRASRYNFPSGSTLIEGTGGVMMIFKFGSSVSIRLFDEEMLDQLTGMDIKEFSKIYINGTCKYVQGDLPGLMKQVKEYYPEAIFPITSN